MAIDPARIRALLRAGAIVGLWAALLLGSHAAQRASATPSRGREIAKIPTPLAEGRGEGEIDLAYKRWEPEKGTGDPVVILHGSPGSADNFDALGGLLARDGRDAIAPDLPGFGASSRWIPDYSSKAHARACLALLDAIGEERAHIVGWSNGGAVAIWMATLAPERVRSVTLLSASVTQEGEGSGSYWFEHAKYAFGYAALVLLAEAIPHFGAFGARAERHAFIRNFWDSDQRPMAELLAKAPQPILVIHSDADFLVPVWAAQSHADLASRAGWVYLSPGETYSGHFLPVMRPETTAGLVDPFFDEVEAGSFTPGERSSELPLLGGFVEEWLAEFRSWHWTAQTLLIGVLAWLAPIPAMVLVSLVVAHMSVDFGVALVGLTLAAWTRRGRGGWFGHLVDAMRMGLTLAALWFPARLLGLMWWRDGHGWATILLAVALMVVLWLAPRIWTRRERILARASIGKLRKHEFWSMVAFYTPLFIWTPLLAIRWRGGMLFTRVNPGIPGGGGIVGESKTQILDGLRAGDAPILESALIRNGAPSAHRLAEAKAVMARRPDLGGLPIIVKPDAGERGRGVRIVRSPEALAEAFEGASENLILQKYHPGPFEAGVLWVRDPELVGVEPAEGRLTGSIFSITIKVLPLLTGDGKRTIDSLLLDHPRYRYQYRMFAKRMRDRLGEIPVAGEQIQIGDAGNHAQGAIFRDGAHLITPRLSEVIDGFANRFAGVDGQGLDFCRFDIRCESAEAFALGEGLAIIEMNGTFSESTNMWDPDRSLLFAWGVLMRQWSTLYELGARRRKAGSKGLTTSQFVRTVIKHEAPAPPPESQRVSRASFRKVSSG